MTETLYTLSEGLCHRVANEERGKRPLGPRAKFMSLVWGLTRSSARFIADTSPGLGQIQHLVGECREKAEQLIDHGRQVGRNGGLELDVLHHPTDLRTLDGVTALRVRMLNPEIVEPLTGLRLELSGDLSDMLDRRLEDGLDAMHQHESPNRVCIERQAAHPVGKHARSDR